MTDDDIVARFWSLTEKRGDDECWPWLGSSLKKDGRGVISVKHKNITAPRLCWFVHHGCWPSAGIFVCHSCDNPNCVNPNHLWLGSNSENIQDAANKKRLGVQRGAVARRGSRHGNAKLNEETVSIMRKEYARGEISIRALAKKYGMTYGPTQLMLCGKAWKHVG